MNAVSYSSSIEAPYLSYSPHEHLPLMRIQDQRPLWKCMIDIVHACLSQLMDLMKYPYYFLSLYQKRKVILLTPHITNNFWSYSADQFPWQNAQTSAGLFLFIHGLRGTPLCWAPYLNRLQQDNPEAHCIAPHVPERGNCSLETAAEPFVEMIRHYAAKFPGQPIHLIGVSNGGRIVSYLENQLTPEDLQGRRLNVVSIAGVHYGTPLIDQAAKWRVLPFLGLHPRIAEDLKWESLSAQRLLQQWRNKQLTWQQAGISVRHFFCATVDDEKLWQAYGSLPLLQEEGSGHLDTYQLYNGQTHQTIIPAAHQDVLNWLRA
ncbi:esterase/lipase family protein [Candidatus Protochlamydia phocaeensis]|uniref:esterase/lipase family protein n=1 Tax=Candidatus Protochlamydia phocaeensis TaxID=1414722 RepID=UPI0008399C99|nr:alpha/beta fold hydrolase [Candidatus Protochlamydia phocaeensis]